jgi:peptidoglycan/LPS O-acetylase OafA/YrhL
MTEYWFRHRRRGVGAGIPLNWKGWVLYVAYLAVIIAIPSAFQWALGYPGTSWLRMMAIMLASIPFAWVAWKKTEGGWHWRSGDEAKDDDDRS